MRAFLKVVAQAIRDAGLAEELHHDAAFRAKLRRDAAAALEAFESARPLPRRVELARADHGRAAAVRIKREAVPALANLEVDDGTVISL